MQFLPIALLVFLGEGLFIWNLACGPELKSVLCWIIVSPEGKLGLVVNQYFIERAFMCWVKPAQFSQREMFLWVAIDFVVEPFRLL